MVLFYTIVVCLSLARHVRASAVGRSRSHPYVKRMKSFFGLWAVVLSLLLCGASAAVASPGDTHVVTAQSAELRVEPAGEATLAMTLEPGRRLKELRRQGAWIKVLVYGEIGLDGWIHQSS